MRIKVLITLISIMPGTLLSQQMMPDTFLLFYLGGQSNMDGYGYSKDLPDTFIADYENVWIFHGNPAADSAENGGLGLWSQLAPGHGVGFSNDGSNNNLSDRFGLELSFAKALQNYYPNKKIALIKYSRGGSSIDCAVAREFGCWDPDFEGANGINQYDHFLATLNRALADDDLNKDGRKDILKPCGILWMQGESDATNEETASKYFDHLKRLMDLIRASLRVDDLPVVIGKISDSWDNDAGKVWPYGELVQHAQEQFARTDTKAEIVRNTRYYKYSDRWHYDSRGYINLGNAFAEAMFALMQ